MMQGRGLTTSPRGRVENDRQMSDTTTGPPGVLTGTVLSSRYRLESKLGSGGMSTVYLARDETLERWVAAKVLHREISDQPDQIERFRREARAVAQVSHPNVVAVIDAGEDGGRPYIVFEYIDGETLKHRIDAHPGGLPLDEAAAYAIEVGRGLGAAHAPPRAAARLWDGGRPGAGPPARPPARPPGRQAPERPHRLRGPREGH